MLQSCTTIKQAHCNQASVDRLLMTMTHFLYLQDLEADLVLWTTGSQPSSKAKASMELPFPCNDKGAMKTYDTLQIVGNPHVFALGDLASSAVDGQQLDVLPATAQASEVLVSCAWMISLKIIT